MHPTLGSYQPSAPPGAFAAEQPRAIPVAMSRLTESVSILENLISELNFRLATVMEPANPKTEQSKPSHSTGCEMADAINSHAERLLAASNNLQEITRRTQL